MSDYMKEAERLADAYANTFFCEKSVTEILGARAALLAHIQRGAVPDMYDRIAEAHDASMDEDHTGCRAILKECMRLLAAAPAPDQFRDAAKMMPVHCTPTEHEGRIVYEHTSEPIPNADGFVLYAASADQFRTAAKMMAVQPACMTCSGHGMVGGSLPNGGGYQADPCPDCAAPAPAEVPMPEEIGWVCWNGTRIGDGPPHFCTYEPTAHQLRERVTLLPAAISYGDDREAAGYARGLRDAVRDANPLVQNGEVLVTVTGLTGSGKSAIAGEIEIMCQALGLEVEWGEGAAEKHVTHADWTEALEMYRPRVRIVEANIPRTDAALRGEVKP